jgi:hypothetical protein
VTTRLGPASRRWAAVSRRANPATRAGGVRQPHRPCWSGRSTRRWSWPRGAGAKRPPSVRLSSFGWPTNRPGRSAGAQDAGRHAEGHRKEGRPVDAPCRNRIAAARDDPVPSGPRSSALASPKSRGVHKQHDILAQAGRPFPRRELSRTTRPLRSRSYANRRPAMLCVAFEKALPLMGEGVMHAAASWSVYDRFCMP